MIYAGLRHVVDFQDAAYGAEYLDRLMPVAAADLAGNGASRGVTLTNEVARHLARAMAYDDVIRVADLKTRATRGARVVREVGVDAEASGVADDRIFSPAHGRGVRHSARAARVRRSSAALACSRRSIA